MRPKFELINQNKMDCAMAEVNASQIATKRKNEFSILRQNSTLAIRTINQIPPNTILTNIYPEPVDPKRKKDYVHNITLIGISEIDGNIIVSSSEGKTLSRMSPINFLITAGIASFEVDTRLLKIHQEILDQYLPKPEQTPTTPPSSCL